MNYHNITKDDMLNGDGLRVVLWVSGCTHRCIDCQNSQTWDVASGIEFDETAQKELFEALDKPHVAGITFSGGDPLHPFNRECIFKLAKKIKTEYPTKTVWLYTGYVWEDIEQAISKEDLKTIDVLVDGEFKKELNDNNLKWVGSSNQRIIDVSKTLAEGKVVLFCDIQ